MFRFFLVLVTILLGTLCGDAGQYNQVLSIGDAAPAWSDLSGVDDQKHSLAHLSDSEVIVVVFTCNSCPYAVDVEDRLLELHKTYADQGVALVAINVNKVEDDLLPAMKDKAHERDFGSPTCSMIAADRKAIRRHLHPRVFRARPGERSSTWARWDGQPRWQAVHGDVCAESD